MTYSSRKIASCMQRRTAGTEHPDPKGCSGGVPAGPGPCALASCSRTCAVRTKWRKCTEAHYTFHAIDPVEAVKAYIGTVFDAPGLCDVHRKQVKYDGKKGKTGRKAAAAGVGTNVLTAVRLVGLQTNFCQEIRMR